MNNLEKYNKIFLEIIGVEENELKGLKYQSIPEWDSVGHMRLVAGMEEGFDIMLDTEDIIDFNSYEKGKEILKKYELEI